MVAKAKAAPEDTRTRLIAMGVRTEWLAESGDPIIKMTARQMLMLDRRIAEALDAECARE